jgi:iron complex transport system substrate-binding protein
VLLLLLIYPVFGAAVEVRDDFNRVIVLESPARRIVSLSPHNTENLFSAGLGDRIVGVDEYSRYPEPAGEIASVGSAVQINIEAIIALEPDLIVVWQTASNNGKLEKLDELGYTLYYSEPRTFDDIIENIEDFAILGDTTSDIFPSPDTLRLELAQLKNRYGSLKTQSVFYQVWTNPLMTLNGDHFISRVLEVCGARNIFSGLTLIAPRVNVEAVVQANPDVIITGDSGGTAADMSMWETWQNITAVANNNYLFVDSDIMHRHTARMIMGIRTLCQQIDQTRQSAQ